MEKRNTQRENRLDRPTGRGPLFAFRFSIFPFRFSLFLVSLVAGVFAAALPAAVYAQGCPLCYNTAAAAKASGIQALRSGILILIIPPLLICAGILWHGIRARNTFNDAGQSIAEPDRELEELFSQATPLAEDWKLEVRDSNPETRPGKY